MQRLALCSLLVLGLAQQAAASGITHIANGDCNGLAAAASTPSATGASHIVLARNGQYGYCPLTINGDISIDGNGASLALKYSQTTSAITVAPRASLTMRNLNFVSAGDPKNDTDTYTCFLFGFLNPFQCPVYVYPLIANHGSLTLDTVSATGVVYGSDSFIHTYGDAYLRNVTLAANTSDFNRSLIIVDGIPSSVLIDHSTLVTDAPFSLEDSEVTGSVGNDVSARQITFSNSIVAHANPNFQELCGFPSSVLPPLPPASNGGNIFTDDTCVSSGPNDRVVADVHFAEFGTHGGVVGNLSLDQDSPAIGNGLVANCTATDARGAARGSASCDSGAYEFGGGQGHLQEAGTSGLFFNGGDNGHYVTVQRVFDGNALVVWNTFNEHGAPAWVYGVGSINGGHIHVDQVAQNLGGTLHPGGAVSGVVPKLWGTFDLDYSDCNNATLSYNSVLPGFGNGSVNLQRLAFVTGLDCSP
jgi:hypothetical protein